MVESGRGRGRRGMESGSGVTEWRCSMEEEEEGVDWDAGMKVSVEVEEQEDMEEAVAAASSRRERDARGGTAGAAGGRAGSGLSGGGNGCGRVWRAWEFVDLIDRSPMAAGALAGFSLFLFFPCLGSSGRGRKKCLGERGRT